MLDNGGRLFMLPLRRPWFTTPLVRWVETWLLIWFWWDEFNFQWSRGAVALQEVSKVTSLLMAWLGIQILGWCWCAPELWVGSYTLQARSKSGWVLTAILSYALSCGELVIMGGKCMFFFFFFLLLFFLSPSTISTSSGQWGVPDRGHSGAENQTAGWGGEPGIYQWDVGGGLDSVLSVSGWERRRTGPGKNISNRLTKNMSAPI